MKFNTLILAAAAAATMGAFVATDARAESIYTAPGAVTTTTSGSKVINETYTAVGTRKVGMVGNRPYPVRTSHVESNTVVTKPAQTEIITYAPARGAAVTTTSVSTQTTSQEPVAFSTGGGQYYTENGVDYYQNPNLNIQVRSTGSFNN